MGLKWYRQVLFDNRVQQRLSMSRTKDSTNQNGDNSLEGLNIDWHMAEYDVPASPISRKADVQPTYAYA
jgi:hypothetical protein|tara:strand:- start:31 stop:237 length:207 start_codon:yes stop_codon:yes gene_type:complete